MAYHGAAFGTTRPRGIMRREHRLSIQRLAQMFGVLWVLCAGAAGAQFNQYTAPGGPQERPESRETRLQREMDGASYHLGPVRIAPAFGIKDVAYVRSLFDADTVSSADVTATVVAGARAYLRTGPKMTWIARVEPGYVWWRRRSEARRFNLSYGLEGVGLFNRLFVGVSAHRTEDQRILTPEVPDLAPARNDEAEATIELQMTGSVYAFVNARENKQSNLVDDFISDPTLRLATRLDRTEKVVRSGLRWRPRAGWTIGVGAERSQTDFVSRVDDNSNSGTAPVLELTIDRSQIFILVDVAARSLTARQGSRFVDFNGVTGNVGVSYRPRPGLEAWIYGSRNLVYSLSPTYPYLDDERIGTSFGVSVGSHVGARVFVETGREQYTPLSAVTANRKDDLRAYGGSLRLLATQRLTFLAQVTRTHFVSDQPGNDRTYTTGGISINWGLGSVL
jgi:hypothetical protein